MSQNERREVLEFKIEQLRKRLLNLSTRNKLLSTKFSDRSRQHFRVVDELPDVLFARLSGKLRFRALPRVEEEPEDERTAEFIEALEAARLTDEDFHRHRVQLEDDGVDEDDPRWAEGLRKLKDRVRRSLELPPLDRHGPSLAEHARRHGVDPSFDLPAASESAEGEADPEKWNDNEIQLLMVPGEMENRVEAVRDRARGYEQERGVNVLGVAFGFLEWREADDARPHHAPLVLRAARIERKTLRSGYVYAISADDDPPSDNETLRVRLRHDFGMELPPLADGELPEAYWKRVDEAVASRPHWRVRRWVAVGLFPFENIVITREIENRHDTIVARKLVGEILSVGGAPDEVNDVAAEAGSDPDVIDTSDLGDHLPMIADADSSQESAVRAVLAGSNLALKGPPGTGKSQTIMNIIGTTLRAGKTVLFVAEKKAALEVVANRLREAGLGELCLELHSDGTRPRNFLDSLGESLYHGKPPKPRGFEAKLAELRRRSEELERYVRKLGADFGTTGRTVQELFWRVREATDSVELDASLLDFPVAGPERFTDDEVERARLALEQVSARHREVFEERGHSPATHPWRGLSNELLTALDLDDVRTRLRTWADSVAALDAARSGTETADVVSDAESLSTIEALGAAARTGEELTRGVDSALLSRAESETSRESLRSLLGAVDELRSLRAEVSARVDPAANTPDDLRALAQRIGATPGDLGARRLAEIAAIAARAAAGAKQVREYVDAAKELTTLLGLEHLTVADVEALTTFADLLRGADDEVLSARRSELAEAGILAELQLEVARLRAERDRLATVLRLDSLPAAATLDEWSSRLERSGALSFLFGAWRRAKRGWTDAAVDARSISPREAAPFLRRAARFLETRDRLAVDTRLVALAGARARGIDTDMDLLARAARLLDAADTRFFPRGNPDALAKALSSGETRTLRVLRERVTPLLRPEAAEVLARRSPTLALEAAAAEVAEEAGALGRLADAVAERTGIAAPVTGDDLAPIAADMDAASQRSAEIAASPDADVLPEGFLDGPLDTAPFFAALDAAESLAKLPAPVARVGFHEPARLPRLITALEELAGVARTCAAAFDAMASPAGATPAFWDGRGVAAVVVAEQRGRAAECLADPAALDAYAEWLRNLGHARSIGLSDFIEAFLATPMAADDLFPAWRTVLRRAQVRDALEQDDGLLKRLSGKTQEQAREDYSRLDVELIKLAQRVLKHRLHTQEVPDGVGGPRAADRTESALIEHEFHKKTRYVPVRDLIRRASKTVSIAKPCFMMSPRSVSTYLPIDAFEFDLVVIDEASQMKPEFAIGALARAKQAVIVGDPLQLPPTDFFSKSLDGLEDAEGWEDDGVDQESVLDQALTAFRPSMTLRWHYRSRHHSLIAPSNHHIYDGELDLTPAPHLDAPGFGVHARRVAGIYRSGTNPIEADAIVEEALRLMDERPDESLGIVAMNVRQRELIRYELDRAILRSEAARAYVERWESARHGIEAPFVKNLENVQGDERDVILVSCVYGPQEEAGPVAQRFGPINGAFGHRRLNVLFTRARNQVYLFSSMDAGDVRVDENSTRGLRFFRAYLEYAATGRLDVGKATGRDPDSPFERWIVARLEAHGFEGVPQVGVAGYRIDVGVRHPSWPHGFLCGIECDGATYHSCASTRDRDRLRQEVLRRLGWDLYRIWSTDWFADPHGETERMIAHLRRLLAAKAPGAQPSA